MVTFKPDEWHFIDETKRVIHAHHPWLGERWYDIDEPLTTRLHNEGRALLAYNERGGPDYRRLRLVLPEDGSWQPKYMVLLLSELSGRVSLIPAIF